MWATMTQTTQASLTMVGLNTNAPQVFWNGAPVLHITSVRVDWEHDEQRIKLHVNAIDPIHDELQAAGVMVKLERRHE